MRNCDSLKCGPIVRFTLMHRADDLDVRIFKELGNPDSLQWNVRETYSSIAKRLGVGEETVRRRLKRAEHFGPLHNWKTMITPRLIGCGATNVQLKVKYENRKADIISELRKPDDVVKLLDFRGNELLLTVYYQDTRSLDRKMDVVDSICDYQKPIV